MLLKAALICCLIATTMTADEPTKSKKKDPRGKRQNLEYSLSHLHPYQNLPYRSERRISLGPYITRYPSFFPARPSTYRKARPQSLPPPYAVQMEPLVQYSQRDPLYDPTVQVATVGQNDLTKNEDLITENNHVSQNIYGPPKHVVERPIYIKEPEPIIEIIIKESNVTLPPVEVPQVTPTLKKKEQVQVFYVKYKKNPHGKGKDSIIYENPIPAISPDIKDEEPPHYEEYKQSEYVTSAPPPSTTLRAIIKPDSETFHADKGIHITFGKRPGHDHDDINEESAPEPAVSLPQGREFNPRPEHFGPDIRIPQPYRPFNQPPPSLSFPPQFGRKIPQQSSIRNSPTVYIRGRPPTFLSKPPPSPSFGSPPPHSAIVFRQPIAYQPFEQVSKPQENFQFPRPHTHFPVRQQLPIISSPPIFNEPIQNRPQEQPVFNHRPQGEVKPQITNQPDIQLTSNIQQSHSGNSVPNPEESFRQQEQLKYEQLKQQQLQLQQGNRQQFQQGNDHQFRQQNKQLSPVSFIPPGGEIIESVPKYEQQLQLQQGNRQQFQEGNNQPLHQQNKQLSPSSFIPPGGELIESVPKYEQHYSVGSNGQLQQISHQGEQKKPFLTQNEFKYQIQQQFRQSPIQDQNYQHNIQSNQHADSIQIQHSQQISTENQQTKLQNQQYEQLQRQKEQIDELKRQTQQIEQLQKQKQLEALQNQNHQIEQLKRQNQQVEQFQRQHSEPFQRENPNFSQFQQQHINHEKGQQSPVYVRSTQPPQRLQYRTSTSLPPTTTTSAPETTTKDPKELSLQLPDEVPDDLRQQLLSSGILNNADISVLDYDKVGDIPLSALPPDQLANFYGAGGGQQIASGSEPIPSVVRIESDKDLETEASENYDIKADSGGVEMKIVQYNPETEEGKKLQNSYIKEDAKQAQPVNLDDTTYNRYLPLKVSGTQFPIPDIPELKGKKIGSVVVLAPVDYNLKDNVRVTRNTDVKFDGINFPKDSPLKQLIDDPSRENYIQFLDNENKTAADQQSVILLVTGSAIEPKAKREIFMYDVATQSVSKLSGELSSAFVDAAEANTDDTTIAASNLVEVRVASPKNIQDRIDADDYLSSTDLDDSPSNIFESRVRIIDPMTTELETEASEQLEHFVDISGQDLQLSDKRHLI